MKRKASVKPVNPAVLKKILGGVQPVEGKGKKKVAVITQPAFNSHFHS